MHCIHLKCAENAKEILLHGPFRAGQLIFDLSYAFLSASLIVILVTSVHVCDFLQLNGALTLSLHCSLLIINLYNVGQMTVVIHLKCWSNDCCYLIEVIHQMAFMQNKNLYLQYFICHKVF